MKPAVVHTVLILLIILTTAVAQDPDQESGSETFVFTDVSEAAGIHATHRAVWDPNGSKEGYLGVGQAWGDYDNDGWLDLYVTGNLDDNVLYRNNGNGTFSLSEFSTLVSLPSAMSGGAIWADFDNDGWLDLYVVNNGANVLFRNDEGQGFSDVTKEAGVGDTGKGASAAWGDYDNDGWLDLYVVNWSCIPDCDPEDKWLSQDRLYRNNGDGSFSDVTASLELDKTIGAGFAASFVDYDNNGTLDLYVVNDKLRTPIGNVLWRNDGPGCDGWCWTDVSKASGTDMVMHAMGLAVADYDNDGQLDFYISNMMNAMVLLRNLGDGSFGGAAPWAGVAVNPPGDAVGWGTAFFDYDNDGWPDLYLAATGMPRLSASFYGGKAPDFEDFRNPYPDALFRNNGDGTFMEVSERLMNNLRPSMGLAYADFDNDGKIDFVQGNWNEGYALYRNEGTGGEDHGWLTLHLIGGGPVNRDAVGAKAYVTTSDGRTQYQQVISGSSLGAGNDLRLHFGLGEAAVERVQIVWPDGTERTYEDVFINQIWKVRYEP